MIKLFPSSKFPLYSLRHFFRGTGRLWLSTVLVFLSTAAIGKRADGGERWWRASETEGKGATMVNRAGEKVGELRGDGAEAVHVIHWLEETYGDGSTRKPWLAADLTAFR